MLEQSTLLSEYGVCEACDDEYAVAGEIFQLETKASMKVCEDCALEKLETGLYTQELLEDTLDIDEEEQNVRQ